ncbi:glucosaminidase domain-containing protein [Sneathiella sp.]|uniref:glucosaminidase domain-containing protein n=1 Tax=Sneathiella sp. TaxID=1964365 RepID=UPI0026351B2E|nr:glucosaminidase domain-containing protein [Sneathiella sp.]MDF2367179.1 glucosaminidase domain-containing protein [Sneathiella sp.]
MKRMSMLKRLVCGAIASALLLGTAVPLRAETITIRNFDDFASFFKRNGYSIPEWKSGTQEVPPYAILDIPEEWRKKVAPDMPVAEKKRTFFRLSIPLAFVANHGLREDRKKLTSVEKDHTAGQTLSSHDQKWLAEQAEEYGLAGGQYDAAFWREIKKRMDIVPPSLIVAQMVDESGWGTSRFAAEGNALFGQWSYKGGIKPKEQRKSKGNYSVAAFKTPLDSVRAYMLNLNSHDSYAGFRDRRAALRADGKAVTGPDLVGTLIKYSERGEAYVRNIEGIMSSNNLSPLDQAKLADGKIMYLVLK